MLEIHWLTIVIDSEVFIFLSQVEQRQDHYRLRMIEPQVDSHANIPASRTLPSQFRKKPTAGDFPSAHSKRSFLKLDPLEQRKIRVRSFAVSRDHRDTNRWSRDGEISPSNV